MKEQNGGGNVPKFNFDDPESYLQNETNADNFDFDNPEPEKSEMQFDFKKPEEPNFLKRLAQNLGIGLAQQGRRSLQSIADIPKELDRLGQQTGNIMAQMPLPGGAKSPFGNGPRPGKKIAEYIESLAPKDFDYAKSLGAEQMPSLMDQLTRGGVTYAPEIVGGAKLAKGALDILPLTQKSAAKPLREASELVKSRGVQPIPFTESLMDRASSKLDLTNPETLKTVIQARGGEYEPAFAVQSDLGKYARDLYKSPMATERQQASGVEQIRRSLLGEMKENLRALGHDDIADRLTMGQQRYRTYKKLDEKVYPVLKKLGIPIGLASLFGIGLKAGSKATTNVLDEQ
jgi:hypothetical protein